MVVGTIICRRQMTSMVPSRTACSPHVSSCLSSESSTSLETSELRVKLPKVLEWKCHVLSTTYFKLLQLHLIAEVVRHFLHHRFVLIDTISSKSLSNIK